MNPGFEEVMSIRGRGMPEDGEVTITGSDPVFSARFKIGETTANILAGVGVAVTDIHEMKTGRRQKVAIDVRHAAATCQSSKVLKQPAAGGGWKPVPQSPSMVHMRSITQPWRCKDGRWYLPHFNLPHLHDRVIGVLECESNAEAVAKAIAQWDSHDLEEAVAEARACGSIVRSNAEWLEHPHGKSAGRQSRWSRSRRSATAIRFPFPRGPRPLSGIKVLDLTRILAGPIAARTLAENGADVLMVTAEHLPQVPEHVMDTSHGKRSCFLNLSTRRRRGDDQEARPQRRRLQPGLPARHHGQARLESRAARRRSVPGSSIFPSAATATAARSPTAADGSRSPSARPGSASTTATSGRSCCRPPPATTRPATTAPTACCSRSRAARAKAARTTCASRCAARACTSTSRGTCSYPKADMGLSAPKLDSIMIESKGGHGTLKHLGPVLRMSETKPYWDKPSPVLGSSRPEWVS